MPRSRTFQLTADLIAAHAPGSPVVCLAAGAVGKVYRLHADRPDAASNVRVESDLFGPQSSAVEQVRQDDTLAVIQVSIRGPIDQRAGCHDPCEGWTDGNDAISERLEAAFVEGDVLLFVDSPGGVSAGVMAGIQRALAAKVLYGRRCTGFVDESAGSLAVWWMHALCDEIFVPAQGAIGSIGSYIVHTSVAGALAKEGVAVTYVAWPDDGKVARAPELPLSAKGRQRAERDAAMVGEAFVAAVCGGAVGRRHGLTPEGIKALSADMLTGNAAVAAGLCDGVASLEEVKEYALSLASGAGESMEEKESQLEDPMIEEEPEGNKVECPSCHMANDVNAKYCDQCGEPIGAAAPEEEIPPSSRQTAPGGRVEEEPKPMPQSASLAAILGATGDSPLALKTAAIGMRHKLDRLHAAVAGVTGETTTGKQIGALLAIPTKLREAGRVTRELKQERVKKQREERHALARRLNALNLDGWPRSSIFEDVVVDGKRSVKLAPAVARMDLDTLRAMVTNLETQHTPRQRDPFKPDEGRAKTDSDAVIKTGGALPRSFSDADKKRLEEHPWVHRLEARGSTLTREKIVEALIREMPESASQFLKGAA